MGNQDMYSAPSVGPKDDQGGGEGGHPCLAPARRLVPIPAGGQQVEGAHIVSDTAWVYRPATCMMHGRERSFLIAGYVYGC